MKHYPIWTHDAINCYELNCDCTRCLLSKILETPCLMNLVVEENLATIGEPTDDNMQKDREPHRLYNKLPSPEELLSELEYSDKKTIAKKYNLKLHKLSKLMKDYNLNGNTIRGKRQKNEIF